MVHAPVIRYAHAYPLNHAHVIWYVPAIVFAVLIRVPATRSQVAQAMHVPAFRYAQPALHVPLVVAVSRSPTIILIETPVCKVI
jgi:hypothetical protein